MIITRVSPHGFEVKSEHTDEWYTVFVSPRFTCTCGDFTFRGAGGGYKCKHIKAVLERLGEKVFKPARP